MTSRINKLGVFSACFAIAASCLSALVSTPEVTNCTVAENSIHALADALNGASADAGERFRRVELIQKQQAWALPKYRAAVKLQQAGIRNAKILCIGDSTVQGTMPPGAIIADNSLSWPAIMAGLIPGGSRYSVAGFTRIESGLSVGAGWAAGNMSIGGLNWESNTATTPISYTPGKPVNTFDVWWIDFSLEGTWTLDINGSGTTTITGTGTNGFKKSTITTGTTATTNTLNILRVSGYADPVLITGYDSANKEISVVNSGVSGYRIANFGTGTNAPWLPLQAIPTYAPDLTIICLTINDWVNADDVTAYRSQFQALITACQQTGDVVIMTGVPTQTTTTSSAQQHIYVAICQDLAAANGCPFVDLTSTVAPGWQSWDAANARGDMDDPKHPKASGYQKIGGFNASKLTQAL